ncbi:MAG: AN1-type zinc finger domain-containing protein [Candidatus Heimdallarchaeaceae archaeon]
MNNRQCSFPECDVGETIPFKCKLCGDYFCAKHRLPEQHNCSKLYYYQTDEYKQAKVSLISHPSENLRNKEKKEKKAKKFSYGSKMKDRTASYLDAKNRFLARSPFFTLYAFGNNLWNVLISILFISTILVLYYVIILPDLKLLGASIGILMAIVLVGVSLIYGGHEFVHHFVGKRRGIRTTNALWLQGLMISLIAIVFPIFVLPPSLLVLKTSSFRKGRNNITIIDTLTPFRKEKGITAFYGILWLLCWEVIAGIFSISRKFLIGAAFLTSLTVFANSIMVFVFAFLVFHLLPIFPLSDGHYIFDWNNRLAWGLWISNIVFYLLFSILNNVLYP